MGSPRPGEKWPIGGKENESKLVKGKTLAIEREVGGTITIRRTKTENEKRKIKKERSLLVFLVRKNMEKEWGGEEN